MSFPKTDDPLISALSERIEKGIQVIEQANEVLLASESSETGVREIDKALKDFVASDTNDVSEKDEEIVKAVASMLKAQKAYKTAQEKARNLYRTNVLGTEEVSESDVDEDALKEEAKSQRNIVMQAITLVSDYAEQNGLGDVLTYAKSLSVPQVGRAGSSTVGQKKPRAYVSVNGTTHESFGEAAKALTTLLSSDDNKVEVTSPDLVSAWVAAGEGATFEFQGHTVTVSPKESAKK